jgi:hypothetical protein
LFGDYCSSSTFLLFGGYCSSSIFLLKPDYFFNINKQW